MTGEGLNAQLEYVFTATDNVSSTLDRMAGAQQQLSAATEQTAVSTEKANNSFMTQQIAVMSVYAGMRRMTSSLADLGIISQKDAEALGKLNSAVGLVVSSFQLIKGAVQIITMLKEAEIGLSIVETYRAVLNKGPAAVALAGAGLGLAAGVAGYLLGASSGSSSTNVTQNVSFNGTTGSRSTARDTLEIMGGG